MANSTDNTFKMYVIYAILIIGILGALLFISSMGIFSASSSDIDHVSVSKDSGSDVSTSPSISHEKPSKSKPSPSSSSSGDSQASSGATDIIGSGSDSIPSSYEAEGAPSPCPSGMVSYWKLNETSGSKAVDSRDGNNGTVYNVDMREPGKVNYSYYFDGNDDYITVPNPANNLNFSGSKNFTIAAWIRLDGSNNGNAILGRGSDWYLFKIGDSSGKLYFYYIEKKSSYPYYEEVYARSNSALDTSKWYFIVGVKNGTHVSLYINGTKQADDATHSNSAAYRASDAFEIGRDSDTGNDEFRGWIDEVAVFNVSLNQGNISDLYTRSSLGNDYCTPFTDNVNPTIAIQSPTATLYSKVPSLNYTVSDNMGVKNCWYELNGGAPVPLTGCGNLSVSPGLPEVMNNLTVYVNDTSGRQSSAFVNFTFDNCPLVPNPGQEDDEGDGIGNACEESVTCPSSLVSYWKLNETSGSTAFDSADSNNGNVHGAEMGQPGKVNYSYYFDNDYYCQYGYSAEDDYSVSEMFPQCNDCHTHTYDYIHVNNPASNLNFSGSKNFTVAAWVKLHGDNDGKVILGRGTDWYYLKLGDQSGKLYFTYIEKDNHHPYYEAVSGVSNSALAEDRWYFIVGVKNGTHVSLYINGTKQNSVGTHSNAPAYRTSDAFEMGRNSDNNGDYFEGNLDEVAVFNAALSQAEITELYTRSLVGKPYCSVSLDTTNPEITIESPEQGRYYNESSVDLNYTVSDNVEVNNCWYTLESGTDGITIPSVIDGIGDGIPLEYCSNITLTGLSDGEYEITVYVNDTSGNENSSARDFTVDTTNPDISIQNPEEGKWYTSSSVGVNFTVNDTNLGSCWFNLTNENKEDDDVPCTTEDISGDDIPLQSCENFTLENLPEGAHTLIIYVNDSAGNENSSSVTFYTDTIIPDITIESPIEQFYPRLTHRVDINYTVNETNPEQCWYDLYKTESGGLINESITLEECLLFARPMVEDGLDELPPRCMPCTNLSSLEVGYGHFCLTIYSNDTSGQRGSEQVCFTTAGAADEASEAPEELLPLNPFLYSIRCSSDGTGDVTIEAWDYRDRPLSGVTVEISGQSDTTGSNGQATLGSFESGEYTASISKEGYESLTIDFTVSCQKKEISQPPPQQPGEERLGLLKVAVQEMIYNNDGTADVELLVQDSENNPIPDATVKVSGDDVVYTTGNDGTVTVRGNPIGDYTATASKRGYNEDETEFIIMFQAKPEPAAVTEPTPLVEEETKIPYSNLCIPILIILLVLGLLFFLWKRRKKEEEPKKAPAPKPSA